MLMRVCYRYCSTAKSPPICAYLFICYIEGPPKSGAPVPSAVVSAGNKSAPSSAPAIAPTSSAAAPQPPSKPPARPPNTAVSRDELQQVLEQAWDAVSELDAGGVFAAPVSPDPMTDCVYVDDLHT
jgi:hypothetical protein